ncbi:DUF4244 domain-containing protein [Aeromicrobium sp.]|uniref:DUF4244 domain-containing protein n=1 Tax=Aeromicrobium sp. TaxID=1871063 RepID=UPI003C645749
MRDQPDRGMATAEYTVGTLGAVMIAAFLFKLGLDDNWFFDELKGIIERALRPGLLIDHLRHVPW